MSMVLTTLPPDADGRVLSVRVANTDAELRAVQALRHRIYVRELRIVPADHAYVVGDRLVDPYDGWSTHLGLYADEELVGTVRVTEALDGPLELAEYIDVDAALPSGARPAEVTRYMVDRRFRRGLAGPILLYAAFATIASGRSSHLVAASKVGSLGQYYRSAGLEVVRDEPFTYGLTGCRYQVGAMHVGAPGTLQRLRQWLWVGAIRLATQRVQAAMHLCFRRRLSPGPALLRTARMA